MKDIDEEKSKIKLDSKPEKTVKTEPKDSPAEPDIGSLAMIEMKIDKILKYQRHVRGIAIFRGVVSLIFLFIFVVLPIIGGFYLFRYIQDTVDLEQVRGQYLEFYETIGDIRETKEQVGSFKETLDDTTENLKNLIQ